LFALRFLSCFGCAFRFSVLINLQDHPGGKKAIMLYAGKDASEEFNMLHDKNVVSKYAPDSIIGTLKK
jgi:cytochrome b involved in lipid metabolism